MLWRLNRGPTIRLTHKPTGISVDWPMRINYPKPTEMSATVEDAKRYLRSKIAIATSPKPEPNPMRSYLIGVVPEMGSLVKQDGRPRIEGADRVESMLRGEFLPAPQTGRPK